MEDRTGAGEGGASVPAPQKNGGGNRLLMGGIIAGVVVLNTIFALILINVTKPKTEEQLAAKSQADSAQHAMERMTRMGATTAEEPIEAVVNIAGTNGTRFLKAAIIFEFDDEESGAAL
jgi:flagellar basal body-associated protein FliL